ncbi:MAG: MarR family winged helix-turn-helix transcriptional regulator [Alphaproteobacteria bacterium]
MTFNIDTFLPFQLSRITNQLSRDLAQVYEKKYEITRSQWRVMAVLTSGPQTAQHISAMTVMDKSVISRGVKELIAKSYVRREASQSDGRSAPLRLTPNGQRIANEIGRLVMEAERVFKSNLSREEQEQLDHIILRLQKPLP